MGAPLEIQGGHHPVFWESIAYKRSKVMVMSGMWKYGIYRILIGTDSLRRCLHATVWGHISAVSYGSGFILL